MSEQDSQDYPAAHSMDTTWFAVDSKGHLAAFDSNEAGAVPKLAEREGDFDWQDFLANHFPRGEKLFVPPVPISHDWNEHSDEGSDETVLFLHSTDIVEQQIQAGTMFFLPRLGSLFTVFARHLSLELATCLHKEQVCAGCITDWNTFTNFYPNWGIYYFAHNTTESWCPGPYSLESMPVKPLSIEHLPADIQSRLKAVTFPLEFSKTTLIQPIEHIASESWSEWVYLSSDGHTVRPRLGYETSFDHSADRYTEAGFETDARSEEVQ